MNTHENKVAVYRLGSLGDTVIALPCFHRIRKVYSEAHITLISNHPVAAKAAPIPSILGSDGYFYNDFITYPAGTRNPLQISKLFWQLRQGDFDVLVNINAWRSFDEERKHQLFFKKAGIKKCVGYASEQEHPGVSPANPSEWEAARLAQRLESIGQPDLGSAQSWDLRLSHAEKFRAAEVLSPLKGQRYIACSPFTKDAVKVWDRANWLAVLQEINRRYPELALVLVGARDERAEGDALLHSAWRGPSLNAAGILKPRESAAALAGAELYIGLDSGPIHLAGAMGTPVVGIYSCINIPGRWSPPGNAQQLFFPPKPCNAAELRVKTCQNTGISCVNTVEAEDVLRAAIHQLTPAPTH